uniref:Ig-like domain-containing protein n=1 Tax=Electrophorus electricus TaxID=8005 RepID=A0AAY5EA62_ELEEL
MCTSSMVMFLITGGQEFNMEGPDVPVVAAPGSDIILPCSIKPKASEQSHVSAVDMEVKWSRTDLNSAVVHHYMDKIDKNEDQDPSYRGRTALFKEELQYGNTSLLLKNVKVSDGGQYTCQVDSAHQKDHVSVLLKVEGIGGAPEITVLGTDSGGVLLQCDSKGWWPVPELQWLDSEGAEVRAGVTESCEDGEGFYVRRSLTAHSSDTNTYICRVKWGQNVMEEKIDITGNLHYWKTSLRFNVEGPDTVFAAPGSDIVLPCSIKPTMSAVDMEVKWSRQDLGDILVHHYMNNSDKNDGQMPSYRGRTALFIEQLQYGNTSLLLKNVEVSDGGQYTCRVDSAKWDGQVRVLLKIEGESVGRTPEITVLGTASGGVLLQCDSKGWWPVPELQWLDSKGVEVPAGVKESCEDGEGFYVRRRLTAHSSDTNTYIFLISSLSVSGVSHIKFQFTRTKQLIIK